MDIQKQDKPSAWQDFLRSNASDDLLMVAHNKRLNYKGLPIHLHWLDRVSLLLIRQAYLQQQSLVLCYPVPICNLPVLAAAQLLIHDLVKNSRSTISVLLISSRTEVREHYLNLNVSNEPVACALPIARTRTDGNPEIIPVQGRNTEDVAKLYHISRSQLLNTPLPQHINAIIVDHVNGNFDSDIGLIHKLASDLKVNVVIHLCTNPFAAFFNELKEAEIPVWVWSHQGLADNFGDQMAPEVRNVTHPFSISSQQFSNIASGIHYHNLISHHPVLEEAAHRLWDDLGTVQGYLSENPNTGIQRAIRASYGIFYTMLQMLVPLPIYEEEARHQWGVYPIRKRIDDLKSLTTFYNGKSPDFEEVYWSSMILDFEEMYKALMAQNPKCETLIQQVHTHLIEDKHLAIVCPNQATKRMLQLYLQTRKGISIDELSHQNDSSRIHLTTYKDLVTLPHCDTLLFPGQFSYSRRHLMLTAAAPEVYYLVYKEEADRIENQTKAVHHALTKMHQNDVRQEVWHRLSGTTQLPLDVSPRPPTPPPSLTRSSVKKVSTQVVDSSLRPDLSIWTPFSTPEYEFGQNVEDEVSLGPSEYKNTSHDVIVPALRIEFDDGFCYAEPNSQMSVYLPATGKTDDRKVDGLRPEDIIMFVNGDQRTRLFEAILQHLKHHHKMGATYILVRYWQQSVREQFSRSGLTYAEFLSQLQKLGSQMKSVPGIRCWIEGLVLGPSKAEDIRRAGEILGDEGLIREWKRIHQALKKIRGLHISLARKLNRVIVQAGLTNQQPTDNECIDAELNLYLDDFRDSIRLQRIVDISNTPTLVPYLFTGEYFTKETRLKW